MRVICFYIGAVIHADFCRALIAYHYTIVYKRDAA